MRIARAGVLLALFVGAVSVSAEAAPITGSFSKSSGDLGSVRCVSIATGTIANCGAADGIDFGLTEGGPGESPTPGVAGAFEVTGATDDFVALTPVGSTGSILDFALTGPGNLNYPAVPITGFEVTVGGVTFDLTSFVINFQNNDQISLSGLGVFHAPGFDDTPGEFQFALTKSGSSFSFAASQSAIAPEPATMALFGLGLAGIGFRLRRRVAK